MRLSQSFFVATLFVWGAYAGSTSTVSNWGDNPSHLPALLVYTPSTVVSNPPIILAVCHPSHPYCSLAQAISFKLHPCGGSGSQFMSQFNINTYADQLGFPVLYPTSNQELGFNCWDCWSTQTNLHNGGGDSQGLAAMVGWAKTQFKSDGSKGVFIIGASSGAMMANVMAATYPDLFKGAASWSGVPAGCWLNATSSTPLTPDQTCPLGQKASTFSAAQWATLAKNADPNYSGSRPAMLITHGTADSLVSILNLNAQLAQWSTVLGLTFNHNVTNDPTSSWKRIVYGDGTQLIGFEVAGGGHIPPFQGDAVFKFFGLLGGGTGSGSTTTGVTTTVKSTTTVASTTSSSPPSGSQAAHWGQCGGQGWTGPTTCVAPYTCTVSNPYYSQCL
ncbi:Alpha/Beta hydrolase protein [Mycena indigotica]|uniref:Alpha/Beta hydrolase protein n=1 Tax=Mycena indigotica TaxID=2126181 RepID=A0A8H6W1F9_9AGAR|nr:Alpha/Beta hydrolase protein [Mycena indigotica]KAF7299476.1 Alpha/Beta hydrolase protein [Mycena indigotica]